MSYDLNWYLDNVCGVSPWLIGKVYRTFSSHDTRLDVLATAWILESEPTDSTSPSSLWKPTIKAWLSVVKPSLGMTGRGSVCADRRQARVDAQDDLKHVVAKACDTEAADATSRLADLVVLLLESLQAGFGMALAEGLTIEQAASRCGISLRTAYYRIEKVREALAM